MTVESELETPVPSENLQSAGLEKIVFPCQRAHAGSIRSAESLLDVLVQHGKVALPGETTERKCLDSRVSTLVE